MAGRGDLPLRRRQRCACAAARDDRTRCARARRAHIVDAHRWTVVPRLDVDESVRCRSASRPANSRLIARAVGAGVPSRTGGYSVRSRRHSAGRRSLCARSRHAVRHHTAKPEPRTMMNDRGSALVAALLVMVLLSALGLSLTMVTTTEERVAHSYSNGSESFYAADAALELAVNELALLPDWDRVLDGSVTSSFVDPAVSSRSWPGGQARTSAEATALVI